jgi:hypothetical protein
MDNTIQGGASDDPVFCAGADNVVDAIPGGGQDNDAGTETDFDIGAANDRQKFVCEAPP